ncbi:hypothetical protein VU00_10175 [Candidatus Electrothrix marina]|uniref:Uncharacterized protein n=1 Tax=Candidatus Electrothrix marina TaxID=1859130 RepID=A0A444JCN9_9BACT|nr:hypothetical protein VU00_10175 [Candidatus Electrothrix marina]
MSQNKVDPIAFQNEQQPECGTPESGTTVPVVLQQGDGARF